MPKIDFVFASLLEDSDSQSSLITQTDDSSSKVEFLVKDKFNWQMNLIDFVI